MNKKLLGFICAVTAVLAMAFSGTAFGQTAQAAAAYRIVALGDSLTFGYEPGITEKSVPYGYVDRFYEQAQFHGRAKISNFGILGLRTEGLLRLLQGAEEGKPLKAEEIQDYSMYTDARVSVQASGIGARTAELRKSLAEANVVTITIGANDFGEFLRTVLTLSKEDALAALNEDFNNKLNKYTEDAEKTIRLTAALAPHARILLTDQYLPLPKLFAPDLYDILYEKTVPPLTAAVEGLSAKLQGEGLDVTLVKIADRFKGKEGSMTHMSITLGEDSKPDIHPTQAGYQAMAEAFAQAMWQEYRKPAPKAAGVPFSVVVAGKEWKPVNKPMWNNKAAFASASDLSKALGAELKWTAKTKTAVFKKKGRTVTIVAAGKTITVNGVKTKLGTPAFLQKIGKESQLYVPAAAMAEAFQYEVTYSLPLQTLFINP